MIKKNVSELGCDDNVPYLLTSEQVCEVFQMSRMQLWRLEKDYGLKSVKLGKKMKRYSYACLEDFIKENTDIFSGGDL